MMVTYAEERVRRGSHTQRKGLEDGHIRREGLEQGDRRSSSSGYEGRGEGLEEKGGAE